MKKWYLFIICMVATWVFLCVKATTIVEPESKVASSHITNHFGFTRVASLDSSAFVIRVVNINTANYRELMSLKNMTKAKAYAILNYRRHGGEFNSVDDLVTIKSIGMKSWQVDGMKSMLTV